MDKFPDNPIIQLAILKGILTPAILSTLPADRDPVEVLIEQGLLHTQQVEKLQKELALDGFDTISTPAENKNPAVSSAKESIAVFGRYVQLEFLGQGGMARVYKAYDPSLKRTVALKFVKVEDPKLTLRLLQEARSQARIEHEHVCKIYEASEVDGKPYIAMQYIAGKTLKQLKDELSLKQKVELMQQVTEGVHAAHKAGLIHRDLKPANIVIEQRESGPVAYVMDFGLARESQTPSLTMSGLVIGTPSYMSPEQARGQSEKIDARTDIYSIGATLYEVITGRPPYEGASSTDILMQVIEREPIPPRKIDSTLPLDLQTIVLKCLEKNPERRYDSARSLSEDLSRFLDGDPIQARSTSWLYRMNKRIKKHPVVSVLVAAAIVAVVVFGAIASVVQWRANEQAKLFQEFGQEVSRIESIMRYAYLLPLHDVQQEKRQVAKRLENIKMRMQVLGSIAYGPGYYSLGRGYISLHNYQRAYDQLIQAWQKHKYREPAVANALGLSLAMIYQEKLRQAEQLYSKDQLKKRKEELKKQYRDPALYYIQQGASTSESQEYVDALIAFLGQNYQKALSKSEAVTREISWLYEAEILQGNIFMAMGSDQQSIGKSDTASEFYKKAKKAYLGAGKKGQSDPQVYEGLCAVHSAIQEMLIDHKGTSPDLVALEGINYCKKSLEADSKHINANLLASRIYNRWAYDQSSSGKDCSASSEKAADFARAALRIDPESGLAYRALGNAYHTLASAEGHKAGNPISLLDLANTNFEKASIRMPEDHDLLSLLGNNFVMRARYEAYAGKDPRPTLEKAMKFLRKAVELNPKYFKAYSNLGTSYYTKGSYEHDAGLDPRKSLEEAIRLFKKSIEMNPNYHNSHEYTGVAYLSMSFYLADLGDDPVPSLNESIAAYTKGLSLAPGDAFSYVGIGIAFMKKADLLQRKGKDPTGELKSARQAFQKSLKANDQIVETYGYFAEAELVAARNAMAQHKSPERFFQEAARLLQAGARISSDCVECMGALASLHILSAEYFASLSLSFEKEIHLGIEAADHALKLNPQSWYAHAHRGKLFLLRARYLSGPARKKAAQEAQASFDQAFKIKHSLRNEYNNDWEEARLLVNN